MTRTCTEPGCSLPHCARGLCKGHWKQQYGKAMQYRITCAWCGKEHVTPRKDGRFCSHACIAAMKSYETGNALCALPAGHPALPERISKRINWPSCRVFFTTCAICKKLFATPYTVSTCSKQCALVKHRHDKRETDHRRRARDRAAFVAPVNRQRIYERDRWRCHICGKKIRKDLIAPHPLSPSIDHLIPIARGGTHEPANVSAAHLLCNAVKTDRGGNEQLMLIG